MATVKKITSLICLKNVSMDFPLYENYSIKLHAIKSVVGGVFKKDHKEKIVVHSLDKINLDIGYGDRLGIKGHNGSGKTTLLRVLDSTYAPSKGSAIFNADICSLTDYNLGLDRELTGLENILLSLKINGIDPQKKIIDEIIDFSELREYINLPVNTYSSGMILRLSFSIASVQKNKILILDEWISTGDQRFRTKISKKLQTMIKQSKALVIASHNEEILKKVCNRIIELKKGNIVKSLYKKSGRWITV